MTLELWNTLASIATVLSTVVAEIGLIGACVGIRQHTRAMELQVPESIFRDIRELDRQYLTEFPSWSNSQQNAWSATFFNTIEYLCFVVNRNVFDDALPAWEKLLVDHSQNNIIRNGEEMFPKFKKACRSITRS